MHFGKHSQDKLCAYRAALLFRAERSICAQLPSNLERIREPENRGSQAIHQMVNALNALG